MAMIRTEQSPHSWCGTRSNRRCDELSEGYWRALLLATWNSALRDIGLFGNPLRSDELEFLLDDSHTDWPFIFIDIEHLCNQRLKASKNWVAAQLQRGKKKGGVYRIAPGKHLVEGCTQAIDVGARCCLRLAILLRRSVAFGTEGSCITALPWFEVAGNTKINQIDMASRCQHDICRFEIAEDNGWLALVQIVKYSTELDANRKDLFNRQVSTR